MVYREVPCGDKPVEWNLKSLTKSPTEILATINSLLSVAETMCRQIVELDTRKPGMLLNQLLVLLPKYASN